MELKVRQLEKARSTSSGLGMPEAPSTPTGSHAGRRSLPSTPSEDLNTWHKLSITKELEEAKKQLKLKDHQILQLKAQLSCPSSPGSITASRSLTTASSTSSPGSSTLTSPEMESKLFKSSLQIAERSKTSSISFETKVSFLAFWLTFCLLLLS